jgi:hypothetical protein
VTRERKEANPSGRAYVRASDLSPEQSQRQIRSGTMAIMQENLSIAYQQIRALFFVGEAEKK